MGELKALLEGALGVDKVERQTNKKAQHITKLDLDSDVKMFKNWGLHAEDLLAGGRPDIQALLDYAATSEIPITKHIEQTQGATPP